MRNRHETIKGRVTLLTCLHRHEPDEEVPADKGQTQEVIVRGSVSVARIGRACGDADDEGGAKRKQESERESTVPDETDCR